MNKQELIKFLKENLKVKIRGDYDSCDSPQVNVSIILDDEELYSYSDYLIRVG